MADTDDEHTDPDELFDDDDWDDEADDGDDVGQQGGDGIGAALRPCRRGKAQRRKGEKKFYPQCRRHDFANV